MIVCAVFGFVCFVLFCYVLFCFVAFCVVLFWFGCAFADLLVCFVMY